MSENGDEVSRRMLDSMIAGLFGVIDGYFAPGEADRFTENWLRHPEFYHFGLGTRIRNELLRPGGALYRGFCRAGIRCADEMSSYVMERYYRYLVGTKR